MRKLVISMMTICLLSTNALAKTRQVTTVTPLAPALGMPYGNNQLSSYPRITQVENIIFNNAYEGDDVYNRLNRIENRLFNRTNPNLSLSERLNNITQAVNPTAYSSNIPVNGLSNIESKLFNRIYSNDDPETRLIRIEKEMLGAMQQGELEDRYNVVAKAVKHYNAFPYQTAINPMGTGSYSPIQAIVPNNIYTQPYYNDASTKSGKIKNILSGIFGGGTVTGYSPPVYGTNPYYNTSSNGMMNPYNQNNYWGQNGYPQSGYGYNNYLKTNTGYINRSKDYGSGAGVHIMYD